MIIYNYSALQHRDTKIYNVGGYNIAGGFSVEFLKVVGPMTLIAIILGVIIGLPFNITFFNPLSDTKHFIWQYTVAWLVLGIGVGCALWYIQFAGYRLYEYLVAYFKPKHVYMNDFKHTECKFHTIRIKAFVKNIL